MRRFILPIAAMLATSGAVAGQTPINIQTIPVPEASGAVGIGHDRLMLIADEGYDVRIVSNAAATFKSGDPNAFASNMKPALATLTLRESKKILNDIEDVAWDEKMQAAFVITSHSLNKDQEEKPARYKLARLVFKNGAIAQNDAVDVSFLKEALKTQFAFVADAMKQLHQAGGPTGTFNIEGLAFDPRTGSLLMGLRSPTQIANGKPCAIVVTLKNPHDLFQQTPVQPKFDPQPILLDLGGLGIRGMTYDNVRRGYWILAGRSDDPDIATNPTPVASSLWFWDSTKTASQIQKAETDSFGFVNLEGVCLITIDGAQGLLLMSDDGDEKNDQVSRYVWIEIPKLLASSERPATSATRLARRRPSRKVARRTHALD